MSPSFPATPLAGIRFTGHQPRLASAYLALSADLFDGGEPIKAWHLIAEAVRLDESIVQRYRRRTPDSSLAEFRVPEAADVTLPAEPSYLRGCALEARAELGHTVGERDSILSDLSRALDLDPNNEEVLLRRGEHYSNLGFLNKRRAIGSRRRGLQSTPRITSCEPRYLRERARTHLNGLRRDYASALADRVRWSCQRRPRTITATAHGLC
jgi:tetratricopeptide (TPR) repeat protein